MGEKTYIRTIVAAVLFLQDRTPQTNAEGVRTLPKGFVVEATGLRIPGMTQIRLILGDRLPEVSWICSNIYEPAIEPGYYKVTSTVGVLAEPRENANRKGYLYRDDRVWLTGRIGDAWAEVATHHPGGWVNTAFLRRVCSSQQESPPACLSTLFVDDKKPFTPGEGYIAQPKSPDMRNAHMMGADMNGNNLHARTECVEEAFRRDEEHALLLSAIGYRKAREIIGRAHAFALSERNAALRSYLGPTRTRQVLANPKVRSR